MKRENEKALIDLQYQTPWEVARVLLLHLYNMNPNIKKPPKTVGKVFQVPWDKNKGKGDDEQSIEEMQTMLKTIHASNKKKINKEKVKLRRKQREKKNKE